MNADLKFDDAIEKDFSALLTEPITSYTERLLQLKSTSKHFHDRYIHRNAEYMKAVKNDKDDEIRKYRWVRKPFSVSKEPLGRI